MAKLQIPSLNSTAIANVSLYLAVMLAALLASQAEAQNRAKPPTDAPGFRALNTPVISTDGAWVAAEGRTDEGDPNVLIWSTYNNDTYQIEHGTNPRISRDSRWVSALQDPLVADSKTAGPNNNQAGQTLILLDLLDGSQKTFQGVLSYDVTYTSSYLLYLQVPKTEPDNGEHSEDIPNESAGEPAKDKRTQGTLHAVHLNGDRVFTIKDVSKYVAHLTHGNHQTNDHFGYVKHDQESGRDTLYLALLNPGRDNKGNYGIRGTYTGKKIEGLRWAQDNATAVFLDQSENTGSERKPALRSDLYIWHDVPGRDGQRLFKRVAPAKK